MKASKSGTKSFAESGNDILHLILSSVQKNLQRTNERERLMNTRSFWC